MNSSADAHRFSPATGAQWFARPFVCVLWTALVLLPNGCSNPAAPNPPPATADPQRKALVIGRGEPLRDPSGAPTHPQGAKNNFLKLAGNPQNDPAKGWTCDLSWDLMERLGMDPLKTSLEDLFHYLGKHKLGYRIAINNGPFGQTASSWGAAVDNRMMPFAPHGNNNPGYRFDDPVGIRAAVSVAGGRTVNITSYGQSLEFIDALPVWASHADYEDAAQSWANQATAAKFAKILDAHPEYNIWDARQHLRQAASFWASGWTETNGYGRVNETAAVGKLLPGPPVEFRAERSRNRRQVLFTWRNFLMSDFATTVIARKDGRILYRGTGTNFVWTSDLDGEETFTYWSENKAGEKSRMESYQTRTVNRLVFRRNPTCLILGAPAVEDYVNNILRMRFEQTAPDWVCDLIYRPGNALFDQVQSFPIGQVVALRPDFDAMVDYAISNGYQIIVAPVTYAGDRDLYRHKAEWDRATALRARGRSGPEARGILVVLPHNVSSSRSRKPEARRVSPPRLFSAVVVGYGTTTNQQSFGPGLEFFDVAPDPGHALPDRSQNSSAARVAGKLAQLLDANPGYNLWDARQHLRQTSSYYADGWREDGGYGRPPEQAAKLARLDLAPPLEIQATKSPDGKSVTFSWENFLQSDFAETVITRKDGRIIFHGTGTNFVWRSDVTGDESFRFYSRGKSGRRSKEESYTVLMVPGLRSAR